MNNIISFSYDIQQWLLHYLRMRSQPKLGTKTSECTTAALDSLCQELAAISSRISTQIMFLPGLRKQRKPQTTVDLLKVRFIGYLRTRVTSTYQYRMCACMNFITCTAEAVIFSSGSVSISVSTVQSPQSVAVDTRSIFLC